MVSEMESQKKMGLKCPLCDFATGHLSKKKALSELIDHIYYQHQNEETTYLLIVLTHAKELVKA
jgi:hypothetical protein